MFLIELKSYQLGMVRDNEERANQMLVETRRAQAPRDKNEIYALEEDMKERKETPGTSYTNMKHLKL